MTTFAERVKRARAAEQAMSPIERELRLDDQRRRYLRGLTGRDPGPNPLAEEVRRLRAMNGGVPHWITRARRHAQLARELDEIATKLIGPDFSVSDMMSDNHFADRLAAFDTLRALAEAERQERARLMQLREQA